MRGVEGHEGMHGILPPSFEGYSISSLDVRCKIFRRDDEVLSVDHVDGTRQWVVKLSEGESEGALGHAVCSEGDRLHLGLSKLGSAFADRRRRCKYLDTVGRRRAAPASVGTGQQRWGHNMGDENVKAGRDNVRVG